MLRPFLGPWCVPVGLCFIDCHARRRHAFWIGYNQYQTLLRSGLTVALIVCREQAWPRGADSFFRLKIASIICLTRSFEKPIISAIYTTFNQRPFDTISRRFVIISSVVAVFRLLGVTAQKPTYNHAATHWSNFDDFHRRKSVTIHCIQALSDSTAQCPFQNQGSNHRPMFLFFNFSEIQGTYTPTRGQNKAITSIWLKFGQ